MTSLHISLSILEFYKGFLCIVIHIRFSNFISRDASGQLLVVCCGDPSTLCTSVGHSLLLGGPRWVDSFSFICWCTLGISPQFWFLEMKLLLTFVQKSLDPCFYFTVSRIRSVDIWHFLRSQTALLGGCAFGFPPRSEGHSSSTLWIQVLLCCEDSMIPVVPGCWWSVLSVFVVWKYFTLNVGKISFCCCCCA